MCFRSCLLRIGHAKVSQGISPWEIFIMADKNRKIVREPESGLIWEATPADREDVRAFLSFNPEYPVVAPRYQDKKSDRITVTSSIPPALHEQVYAMLDEMPGFTFSDAIRAALWALVEDRKFSVVTFRPDPSPAKYAPLKGAK